eukprot:5550583-Pleurochrysis_carterae.AAC.1
MNSSTQPKCLESKHHDNGYLQRHPQRLKEFARIHFMYRTWPVQQTKETRLVPDASYLFHFSLAMKSRRGREAHFANKRATSDRKSTSMLYQCGRHQYGAPLRPWRYE